MAHYVTKQPGLKFIRDGKTVALPAGSPVPEAESLPNFAAMIRIGQLALVDVDGKTNFLDKFDERERKRDTSKRKEAVAQSRAKKSKKTSRASA